MRFLKFWSVASILALPPLLCAQAPARKFEVVSVKPCADGNQPQSISAASPGRLVVNCVAPMALIAQAYVTYASGSMNLLGERLVPIEKAPAWAQSERFTIEAKAQGTPSAGAMRGPMLAALLEDRFQLKIHSEMREGPVYDLAVAKGGPKLEASKEGSCIAFDFDHPPAITPGKPPGPICKLARITADAYDLRHVTLAEFGVDLARGLGRDVIDKTGIPGVFDIHVDLQGRGNLLFSAPPPPPPGGAALPPAPPKPVDPQDVFSTLQSIVQKLGLKLESGRGPSRFLVIDHVERPPAN